MIISRFFSLLSARARTLSWGILAILVFASSWSLFQPYLGLGHDLNHQARVYEMARGLLDGNFPVIWSQNLGYGYGMPLFQFYAPFPYYLGAAFYLSGFTLMQSVELILLLVSLTTCVGSYLLGWAVFRNRTAALVCTALLMLAPYRAVDVFVRLAISEAWAIAFLPWVLLGIVEVVRGHRWGWLIMCSSFALLILSHNISALFSLPFLALFGIGYLAVQRISVLEKYARLRTLFFAGVLALGLSAFYAAPAILEKDATQVEQFTLTSFYDVGQHFLYLRQFFEPWGVWEFGGSGWGPDDEMSFFLGYAQLFVFGVSVLASIQIVRRTLLQKRLAVREWVLILLGALTLLSLFLTLTKSEWVWSLVPIADYVQFPWRLLAITSVFGALLGASALMQFPQKLRVVLAAVILVLLLSVNPRYFQSERYFDYTPYYQDYAEFIRTESSENLYDYIPKDMSIFQKIGFYLYRANESKVPVPATSLLPEFPQQAFVVERNESTYKEFQVNLEVSQSVPVSVAYYPGWVAVVNGEPVSVQPNTDGLISLELPSGKSKVVLQLRDTPVRRWSKRLSVASALVLAGVTLWQLRVGKAQRVRDLV